MMQCLELSIIQHYVLSTCASAANGVAIATEKKLPSILVDETSVSNLASLLLSII